DEIIAYSKDDSKCATLITIPEGKEKKQFIRVFDQKEHIELCCVDVTAPKKHGIIHKDAEFGGLKWSDGGGHLLYTAEKFVKRKEYYDAELDWSNEEKFLESNVGEKYELVESWGEQLHDIRQPVLCIFDVISGSVTVLDHIPDRIAPLFSVWAPNDEGIVFFGIRNDTVKLGKVYCNNRSGTLYYYELSSAKLIPVSEEDVAIERITFSPDNSKLVYFQREAGGPHNATVSCQVRMRFAFAVSKHLILLLLTYLGFINNDLSVDSSEQFPGLHDVQVAERCNLHGCWSVLDVYEDYLVAVCSAPDRPPTVLVGHIPNCGDEEKVNISCDTSHSF
ncbi:unnamed protein product, partial [Gongylonema pulchrum]|uniref:APEH_N domain-containing protein n=1 Tax=Gongylonema pulchrum TaxID=637853 RepID=A0A183D0U4_9BILA